MKQVSVSIPEELKAKLDKSAAEKERSISWIIREIIQKYYEQQVNTDKE